MRALPVLALALSLAGCVRSPTPPAIHHVVFCTLKDPAEADALVADCARTLAPIPSVRSYACGRHLDTGRAGVDTAYDVAILIGFATPEDYQAYETHPGHVALVARWMPRLSSLTIRDIKTNIRP